MKIKPFASILALFLLSFVTPQLATAQTGEAAANGKYQFAFEDRYVKYVEFDAITRGDGNAVGQMFFSDEAEIVYQDVDGTGVPEETIKGFAIKVEFDGMVVNKNQAVMSGIIQDSSLKDLVGQRVLLTVEDNGDNTKEPDRLTWGIYRPVVRDWIPSDAELEKDPGVGLTWIATDAERRDDEGIRMPRDESISAQTFPLSSYDFADVAFGAGDILVQP